MPSCSTPELPPMNSREHFEIREEIVNRFCGQKINKNSRYLLVISFSGFPSVFKNWFTPNHFGSILYRDESGCFQHS